MINFSNVPTPCYLVDEIKLRRNLAIIKDIKDKAGINIILAFKGFAMWSVFPIFHQYGFYEAAASSPWEAKLAFDKMGSLAHTYSPAYTTEDFDEILKYSSTITFNSIGQFERFKNRIIKSGKNIKIGLRVNPEFSEVETDLYNPCSTGSRLGILAEDLVQLPNDIDGLHFHALCESDSYSLEKVLNNFETKFGHLLPFIKFVNMGGGHLITKEGYNHNHLIELLKNFKIRYPHIEIILEPGSAFAWDTGYLVSKVIDLVENNGIKTAILNVSFTCHMPDCLEMPYKPRILGAFDESENKYTYRMGGNSCLSGDYFGNWSFDNPLSIDDIIVFNDMIHYTMVKTTTFNGIIHPDIGLWTTEDKYKELRHFQYEDYKNRLS